MNYIKVIVFSILLLLFIIIGVKQQIDINMMKDELKQLQEVHSVNEYENQKDKNLLDAPMDDEYIKQTAEQELDLKDPNAQYFYNDLPD